ncbi:putative glycoside hydrolase [Triangularia verruculosa]|uniref:Mannan endo-1,6-alpha-mannosidase n=1 Tax=Triangularia verruculosa TaxID=2587418 RepID=A0AAN7B0T0_9PEZI|nr:putative glycoside hydrolase [Triangularia verruculosa]
MRLLAGVLGAASLLVQSVTAIDMVISDEASVKAAAKEIAFGLVKYYTGNNTGDTPGNLPDPYFWWEAGAMFGTLIDYWQFTGDSTYNAITKQAILHQASETRDFMPRNQTRTLGNDDQGFWAMTAMTAAELRFPDPSPDEPQYLALAQAVFNQWAQRWEENEEVCGGGLPWQIFRFNRGFNYRNSISNGCFFNIASRLARFTGNVTYAEWAAKIYAWQEETGLFRDGDVLDGVTVKQEENNSCDSIDEIQWTYNAGIFIHGSAVMYNFTDGNPIWKRRLDAHLESAERTFYTNSTDGERVMFEQFCEPPGFCDIDQRSFKGYLTRWMARATQLAPYTVETISPLLTNSAVAAAKACSGSPTQAPQGEQPFRGTPGTACGFSWTKGGYDGMNGVGEQMNALSAVASTLVDRADVPVTGDTGGTSRGDATGGANGPGSWMTGKEFKPITTGERVAAGFLTAAMVFGVIGGSAFLIL